MATPKRLDFRPRSYFVTEPAPIRAGFPPPEHCTALHGAWEVKCAVARFWSRECWASASSSWSAGSSTVLRVIRWLNGYQLMIGWVNNPLR